MNNEELKKKISEIALTELQVQFGCGDTVEVGDREACAESIADALIAAGIGDVKDLQAQVNALEMTNIALQAGYDGAEKDRLYWVNKYKEAECRVAKAERALVMSCANTVKDEKSDVNVEHVIRVLYYKYLKQAENELAEDRKDG